MDRVPKRLAARSRRTPTLLICLCFRELFNHRSPSSYFRVSFERLRWSAITRKNNVNAGGAKKKHKVKRRSSRVQKRYTDWLIGRCHNACKDARATISVYHGGSCSRASVVEKLSKA
jgi:hypothetical protein